MAKSVFQKSLHTASLLIFSAYFQKYEIFVYKSAKQAKDETFFSNLGLNVWRNQPEIANRSNTVAKVRQFSTECTNAFIANVYKIKENSNFLPDVCSSIVFFYTNRHFSYVTTPFYRC